MEFFTFMGLVIAIFVAITCFTAFLGWLTDEDDHMLHWLMTCMFYAVSTTIFIMKYVM